MIPTACGIILISHTTTIIAREDTTSPTFKSNVNFALCNVKRRAEKSEKKVKKKIDKTLAAWQGINITKGKTPETKRRILWTKQTLIQNSCRMYFWQNARTNMKKAK